MILVSSLVFFLVIFLLASILTAIAYLAFLKMKADQSDAELQRPHAIETARISLEPEPEGQEELGFRH